MSDFGSAALRHAELKASRALTIDDVAALADAWQRATTQAQQTAYERARALGINGDDAAASLERTVGAALAVLVARLDLSRTNIATLPTSMQLAVAELRSQHLDALELMVSTWRDRLADPDKRGRPVVDELREWCALRELCSAVEKTGDDGAYLAFEAGQWVICELAVQLWNERKEYRVANAMFRSLLSQARALGDTRAIETQEKNVACGC